MHACMVYQAGQIKVGACMHANAPKLTVFILYINYIGRLVAYQKKESGFRYAPLEYVTWENTSSGVERCLRHLSFSNLLYIILYVYRDLFFMHVALLYMYNIYI